MKVSIIVPVYNSEAYLERCFNSIRRQTLGDFECIIVDDGSSDNSGRICDEYASLDKRFVVIHKKNEGVSKARNTALRIAKGEYVGFVDSDDWIEDNMYESLYEEALKTSSDIVICGCTPFNNGKVKETLTPKDALLVMFDPRKSMAGYSVTRLIKRTILDGVFYDENITCYEDMLFFYHLFPKAGKIYWHDVPYYHYEARSDSAVNSYLLSKRKKDGIEALRNIARSEKDDDIRESILSFIYIWYLEEAINYVSHGNVDSPEFSSLLTELKKNRKYLKWGTLREKAWYYIILDETKRKIYWAIKGKA